MDFRYTVENERNLPRWFARCFDVLSGLKAGRLDVHLPDGRAFRVDGADPGPVL